MEMKTTGPLASLARAPAGRGRPAPARRGGVFSLGELGALGALGGVLSVGSVVLLACSATPGSGSPCVVGADCASGVCNADGTCAEQTTSTMSSSSGGGSGGAGTTSSASSGGGGASSSSGSATSSSGTGGSGLCVPDMNGTITAQEMPIKAGLSAKFRIAGNPTWDTTGTKNPDGSRTWKLNVALPGDHASLVQTLPLDAGLWFAKDYYAALPAPENWYVSRLSDSSDIAGVFERTDAKLVLHGIASLASGSTATELFYGPGGSMPVTVLEFPLTEGKTWKNTAVPVSGTLQGITIGGFYTEDYSSVIDAHGTLESPYGNLPVLRVVTKRHVFLNGVSNDVVTHAFVSECLGTVGNVFSKDYVTTTEMTDPKEVRRLDQ